MITETCQRWREHRMSRRPAGELISTAEYDVWPISPTVAKAFVTDHHYAGNCSSTAHPFGLHRFGELVGVACFGPACSTNAHNAVFPMLTQREAVTLGRLVLLDEVPGNGESWFVARCFALLRARGIVAVESCADPQQRTTLDGVVVHRGHVGTVYSALNGLYVGLTNDASLRLLPDGTCYSNKAAGKVCQGKQGRAYAGAELVSWGADPLLPGEDAKTWLKRWAPKLTRTMRHRGNHRYLWVLNERRRGEILAGWGGVYGPRLAYPKIDQRAV